MNISFRQGIVSYHTVGNTQRFLEFNGKYIRLLASTPVVITLSHFGKNYSYEEKEQIDKAWGPIPTAINIWIYWDLDLRTGNRTFGFTRTSPIIGPFAPPNPTEDLHWFDLSTKTMKLYHENEWVIVLRVFAARLKDNIIAPVGQGSGPNSFTGSQVGITNIINKTTNIVFDDIHRAVKTGKGTFVTETDRFFAGGARVIPSRIQPTHATGNTIASIPAFSVVVYSDLAEISVATYTDSISSVVALTTDNIEENGSGSLVIQGIVTNPQWNWAKVNTPLWISLGGILTDVDAYVYDPGINPIQSEPVARVLTPDTIIFEQGLGGIGKAGIRGSIRTPTAATPYIEGSVMITTDNYTVISTDDPRMQSDYPSTACPHTHLASAVSFDPFGTITSTNTQLAIQWLSDTKYSTLGGTYPGNLFLTSPIIDPLQSITKQYIDSLVNGLIWIDPVSHVNLISDNISDPTTISPQFSDVYFIPSDAVGVWESVADHYIVYTETGISDFIDLGLIADIPVGTRFGIAMETATTPSGSFTDHSHEIATLDVPTLQEWSYYHPESKNAVFVNNESSLHAYHQYAFNASTGDPDRLQDYWFEFGGRAPISTGNNLVFSGNILDTRGTLNEGSIDALTLSGILASGFSLVSHAHSVSDIDNFDEDIEDIVGSILIGTQTNITVTYNDATDSFDYVVGNLIPTLAQVTDVSLFTVVDNDILSFLSGAPDQWKNKAISSYNPASSSVLTDHIAETSIHFTVSNIDHGTLSGLDDGMLPNDHPQYLTADDGDALYYLEATVDEFFANIINEENQLHNVPYDLTFSIDGFIGKGDSIVGSLLFSRTVEVDNTLYVPVATVEFPPEFNITYLILHNGIQIGSVLFQPGSQTGTVTIPDTFTLFEGDMLQIQTQAIDALIENIYISFVGCALGWDLICEDTLLRPGPVNILTTTNLQGQAVFTGGSTNDIPTGYTDVYSFADDSVTKGTDIGNRTTHAGIGNPTIALFAAGNNGADIDTTLRYLWADGSISTGTTLGLARNSLTGIGDDSIAIFSGGSVDNLVTDYSDKYTYSSFVVNSTTVLGIAVEGLASFNTGQVGIIGGGKTNTADTTYLNKYIFADDTTGPGVVLGVPRSALAGIANNTIGVFGGGTAPTTRFTQRYIFLTDTISESTLLGLGRTDLAATGNGSTGILGGGRGLVGETTYIDKYDYITEAMTQPAALGVARQGLAAASNAHGGLIDILVPRILLPGQLGDFMWTGQYANTFMLSNPSTDEFQHQAREWKSYNFPSGGNSNVGTSRFAHDNNHTETGMWAGYLSENGVFGFYYSQDNGLTWALGTWPPGITGNANDVMYDKSTSRFIAVGRFYAGSSVPHIVLISDNGMDWRYPADDSVTFNNSVYRLYGSGTKMIITNDNTICFVGYSGTGGVYFFWSADGGDSWTRGTNVFMSVAMTYDPFHDYIKIFRNSNSSNSYLIFTLAEGKNTNINLGSRLITFGNGFRFISHTNELGTTILGVTDFSFSAYARIYRNNQPFPNIVFDGSSLSWNERVVPNSSIFYLPSILWVKGIWYMTVEGAFVATRIYTSIDDGYTWKVNEIDGNTITYNGGGGQGKSIWHKNTDGTYIPIPIDPGKKGDFLWVGAGEGDYMTSDPINSTEQHLAKDWEIRDFPGTNPDAGSSHFVHNNDHNEFGVWAGQLKVNGIFSMIYSIDGGISWLTGNHPGDISSGFMADIVHDKPSGRFIASGRFYAGTSTPHLIIISDDGINWRYPANDSITFTSSFSNVGNQMAITGAYAVCMIAYGSGGIKFMWSIDGGESWTKGNNAYASEGLVYNTKYNYFTAFSVSSNSTSYITFTFDQATATSGGFGDRIVTLGSYFQFEASASNDLGTTIVVITGQFPEFHGIIYRVNQEYPDILVDVTLSWSDPSLPSLAEGGLTDIIYTDGVWYISTRTAGLEIWTSSDDGLTWESNSIAGDNMSFTAVTSGVSDPYGWKIYHKDTDGKYVPPSGVPKTVDLLGGSGSSFTNGITTNNDGVYVTGYSQTPDPYAEAMIIKYSSNGSVIWQRSLGIIGENDIGSGIITDSTGNVYITGHTSSNQAHAGVDLILIKYTSGGDVIWQRSLGEDNQRTLGKAIAIDSDDNLYIVGTEDDTPESWPSSEAKLITIKYTKDGLLLWQRKVTALDPLSTSGQHDGSYGHGVSVDSFGNVYACGHILYQDFGYTELFINKYDTNGILLWQRSFGTYSNWESKGACKVDSTGNIYIVGKYYVNVAGGERAVILGKFDSMGDLLWQREVVVTTTGIDASDLAFDSNDNIYITGQGKGSVLIIKYNPQGEVQYQRLFGSEKSEDGFAIALDGSDKIWIAGYTLLTNQYNMLLMSLPSDGSGIGPYGEFTYSVAPFEEREASGVVNFASTSFLEVEGTLTEIPLELISVESSLTVTTIVQ